MMSTPRPPGGHGFGTARDIATRMPAATSLRIVVPHLVGVTPEFVVSFMSYSFRMGQGELLVYALVARDALPRRSRSAAIFMRIDAAYAASVRPSRLISTLASAPRAPASAIKRATCKSDRMDAATIASSCPRRSKSATARSATCNGTSDALFERLGQ